MAVVPVAVMINKKWFLSPKCNCAIAFVNVLFRYVERRKDLQSNTLLGHARKRQARICELIVLVLRLTHIKHSAGMTQSRRKGTGERLVPGAFLGDHVSCLPVLTPKRTGLLTVLSACMPMYAHVMQFGNNIYLLKFESWT